MSANVDFASLVVKANSTELKQLRNAMREVDGQAVKTEKKTNLLSGSFKKLAIAAGGYFAVSKLASGFKSLTDSGSDLFETINKGAVVLGNSFSEVEKFADGAASALGQSKKQAIDAASTFGIFGKSAGLAGKDLSEFSIEFTTLASDFASFYNTSPEEAITAIGAAFRGENEPIRKYGILLDDMTLRQAALSAGIVSTTKKALTPQQKVLAASKVIMKQSSDAQGDFARTSDGLANSTRINKALLSDLAATFGKKLLPSAGKISDMFRDDLLPALKGVVESETINNFLEFAPGAFEDMAIGIKNIVTNIGNLPPVAGLENLVILLGNYAKISASARETSKINAETGKLIRLMSEEKELLKTITSLKEEDELVNKNRTAYAIHQVSLEKEFITTDGKRINTLQGLIDRYNELTEAKKSFYKTKTPTTDGTSETTKDNTGDTSWSEFKDVLKSTSELNEQKLKLTEKSNNAINAMRENQLSEDIARDVAYRQLVESANIAEIESKTEGIEQEIALHEYKFDRLKELYTEGSAEITQIERIETAERASLDKELAEQQIRNRKLVVDSSADAFNMMSGLAKEYAGEQSGIYKGLFLISKGFAMADAIVNLNTVISKATASAPPPYNVPAIIAAGIQGAIPIAGIAAATFAGMKDLGGTIPYGKWGIAGEFGPEIVQGPANVVSRADTANILKGNTTSNDQRPIEFHTHIEVSGNYIGNNAAMRDLAKEVNKNIQKELTRVGA